MSSIRETAAQFVDACDSGKGWEACSRFCHEGATFSVQADALKDQMRDGLEADLGMGAFDAWLRGRREVAKVTLYESNLEL